MNVPWLHRWQKVWTEFFVCNGCGSSISVPSVLKAKSDDAQALASIARIRGSGRLKMLCRRCAKVQKWQLKLRRTVRTPVWWNPATWLRIRVEEI